MCAHIALPQWWQQSGGTPGFYGTLPCVGLKEGEHTPLSSRRTPRGPVRRCERGTGLGGSMAARVTAAINPGEAAPRG